VKWHKVLCWRMEAPSAGVTLRDTACQCITCCALCIREVTLTQHDSRDTGGGMEKLEHAHPKNTVQYCCCCRLCQQHPHCFSANTPHGNTCAEDNGVPERPCNAWLV
jgi:hypothetical protein